MTHAPLQLTDFRAMVREGLVWRRRLQTATAGVPPGNLPDELVALSVISARRDTWSLALATAAFQQSRRDGDAPTTPLALVDVVQHLAVPGRELRDFVGVAQAVTERPAHELLHRAAPRLLGTLRRHPRLSVASIECTLYCMKEHPRGGEALQACLRGC